MSDTVKLVIDLSEEQRRMVNMMLDIPPQVENDLISAIRHGTPLSEILDKIKGEIRELRDSWEKDCYHDEAEALNIALKIIDKHISAEKDNTWERTTETMKK